MKGFTLINLLLIIAIVSPGEAYRILGIFPMNGKSHFIMMGALMKGLARRGHTVDVVSHFPLESPLPNYNDIINLSGNAPQMHNNMTYEMIRMSTFSGSIAKLLATVFSGRFCDLMDLPQFRKLIKNPPKDPPYDLVITEVLGAPCYLALGDHFKVPIVGASTSPLTAWVYPMVANPEESAYVPDIFSIFGGRMNFWERLQNTLDIWKKKWEFDYYSAYQDDKIKKYIGPHVPSLREVEKNLSLILINSHFSVHGARPYTTAVVEVGGIHIPETIEPLPKELQQWLDESKDGFAYVSFGSMMKIESFPETSIAAIYSSLGKLAPLRVLMKIANPEELPPGLPSNVHTLSWIPQLPVLMHKHARVFLTHGGLFGMFESIYSGVPMIGVPLFGDQMGNVQLCVRKNIAVSLDVEDLTEEKLDAAFKKVLGDPSYMESAKKLSTEFRDRPMSAMETANFWIEYVIRHGGTNLRSPALELAWWQIAMFDIYGALLMFIALSVYLVSLLTMKVVTIVAKNGAKYASRHKKTK